MIGVTENFSEIQDLLARSCTAAGRSADAVTLLAVSKTKPLEMILDLADAGQYDFGENFVQEGVDKIGKCGRNDLRWHFIGHLQSNKSRAVAEHFDWVHTVDRARIARRLSAQRPSSLPPLNVCLQVNVDEEPGKSGVVLNELDALAAEVVELPAIKLRGLMCIPAVREDKLEQREPFRRMREAFERLNDSGYSLDTLSMGMIADYDAAIQEGATMVRIGTALFGARD